MCSHRCRRVSSPRLPMCLKYLAAMIHGGHKHACNAEIQGMPRPKHYAPTLNTNLPSPTTMWWPRGSQPAHMGGLVAQTVCRGPYVRSACYQAVNTYRQTQKTVAQYIAHLSLYAKIVLSLSLVSLTPRWSRPQTFSPHSLQAPKRAAPIRPTLRTTASSPTWHRPLPSSSYPSFVRLGAASRARSQCHLIRRGALLRRPPSAPLVRSLARSLSG